MRRRTDDGLRKFQDSVRSGQVRTLLLCLTNLVTYGTRPRYPVPVRYLTTLHPYLHFTTLYAPGRNKVLILNICSFSVPPCLSCFGTVPVLCEKYSTLNNFKNP